MTDQSMSESAVRARARTRGYHIRKSQGSMHFDNYGKYTLIDSYPNAVVLRMCQPPHLVIGQSYWSRHRAFLRDCDDVVGPMGPCHPNQVLQQPVENLVAEIVVAKIPPGLTPEIVGA